MSLCDHLVQVALKLWSLIQWLFRVTTALNEGDQSSRVVAIIVSLQTCDHDLGAQSWLTIMLWWAMITIVISDILSQWSQWGSQQKVGSSRPKDRMIGLLWLGKGEQQAAAWNYWPKGMWPEVATAVGPADQAPGWLHWRTDWMEQRPNMVTRPWMWWCWPLLYPEVQIAWYCPIWAKCQIKKGPFQTVILDWTTL